MAWSLTFLAAIGAAWLWFGALSPRLAGQRVIVSESALAGLVCYALSYALNQSYHLMESRESMILVWQLSLTGIVLLYFLTKAFMHYATAADWAILAFAFATLALVRLGVDRHSAEAALIILIVISCWRCLFSFTDFYGKLVWSVLLIAEAAQLPQKILCHAYDPGPSLAEIASSACERAAGPVAAHAVAVLTAITLLWFISRAPRHEQHRS